MNTPPPPDSPYAVISTGGFFLMFLLLMLPIIGLIAYIIIAVSGSNQNRRNFCRATLLLMIINAIISVIASILIFIFANAFVDSVKHEFESQGSSLEEFLQTIGYKSCPCPNDSTLPEANE